ncbi:MAG: GntR family transcriptional regulator [bacterium]|nr:GntR family transcriptional regulator [bacterium]
MDHTKLLSPRSQLCWKGRIVTCPAKTASLSDSWCRARANGSPREVAASLGVSSTTARTALRRLDDSGLLTSEGRQRGRRYCVSPLYTLDFPSKNSDINSLGELGDD